MKQTIQPIQQWKALYCPPNGKHTTEQQAYMCLCNGIFVIFDMIRTRTHTYLCMTRVYADERARAFIESYS